MVELCGSCWVLAKNVSFSLKGCRLLPYIVHYVGTTQTKSESIYFGLEENFKLIWDMSQTLTFEEKGDAWPLQQMKILQNHFWTETKTESDIADSSMFHDICIKLSSIPNTKRKMKMMACLFNLVYQITLNLNSCCTVWY